jgi:tRNA-modifying protein YgfZ
MRPGEGQCARLFAAPGTTMFEGRRGGAMAGERVEDRAVIGVSGADAPGFLQGLETNDLRPLAAGPGIVWTALLTPQGKYLADFFVVNTGDRWLIDVKADLAPGLLRRLAMYRLRADVQLALLPVSAARGLGAPPQGGFADPRPPALGWPMASRAARPRSTGRRSGWSM